MQVRAGAEMLAVLVVVLLAASGTQGLKKCELRQEMQANLPTKVLDYIKNEMAKIVCHVELMTGFNTSVVTNITLQEKYQSSRHARSAPGSSSEESSEQVIRKPKPSSSSSMVRPTTVPQGNTSSPGSSSGPRRIRPAYGSNSEESHENEDKPQPTFNGSAVHPTYPPRGNASVFSGGRGPRRTRAARRVSSASSKDSSEVHTSISGFNMTAGPHRNCSNSTSTAPKHHGRGGRNGRSVHQSSMESGEADFRVNSTTITPSTGHQVNDSSSRRGHASRHARSTYKFSIAAHWSAGKDSKEEPTQEPTEEPDKESSEESNNESHEESSEESHEESSKESSEESHEESSKESSEESHEEPSEESNYESSEESSTSDTTFIPPTVPQWTKSPHPRGRHLRVGRSTHESDSSPEAEDDVWTLYGLFQLPGHIACSSGSEPSFNLCNMSCDNLLNADITDDITCVGTIISKMMPVGKRPVHTERAIQKLLEVLHKKECDNVVDSQYFSDC